MATPPDPPLACPVALPLSSDRLDNARQQCAFGAGADAETTLGVSATLAASIPVRHVIVVMKENRSFDQLLGQLPSNGQPDCDAIPPHFANSDLRGEAVGFHPSPSTCSQGNPPHQWDAMHASVNGGAMDGFVIQAAVGLDDDGHSAMISYGRNELPFYTWLANTYAVDDRHFASALSGTDPNRDFLVLGTAAGIKETGAATPDPSTPNIFRELMDAGFTWGTYSDGYPLGDSLGWENDDPGTHSLADLIEALDAGTLPNVAFVDGIDSVDDDNPPADLQRGERWLRRIYQHAVASPQWDRLAMIWTYDEAGGYADHVPPPAACVADATPLAAPFFELGPRVPFVVISPYAKPHYVSHVVEEHTAITRFIETLFDLPALTARDANSTALLDMFDFSCDPALSHPAAAPEAGRHGCSE